MEAAVATEAGHVGGGEEMGEGEGVVGFYGVIVDLAEESGAVGEGDQLAVVGLGPVAVDFEAPVQFVCQGVIIEGFEVLIGEVFRLPVHLREQLLFDFGFEDFEVMEAFGEGEIPGAFVVRLPWGFVGRLPAGDGARLEEVEGVVRECPFHVLGGAEEAATVLGGQKDAVQLAWGQ